MWMKCDECMFDAPYHWCCRLECGQHEFCRGCDAKSQVAICPNGSTLTKYNDALTYEGGDADE